jgi:putative phage-type endonuclease
MNNFLPEWAAENCQVLPNDGTKAGWLHSRTFGLTGTDISAIMNANPYKTPFSVWMDKTGQSKPVEDNEAMRIGRIIEPGLRADAIERVGMIYEAPGCLQSRKSPIICGTPDGMREGIPWIYEFKTQGTTNRFASNLFPDEWGESGTDMVPIHYLYQCMWYMALTGADQAELVAFLAGNGIREYTIQRDEEIIGLMIERGERFWRDHIEGGVVPEVDGSEGCSEWLLRKHPHADKGRVIEADPVLEDLISKLARYKSLEKTAAEEIDLAKAQIQAIIGDAYKVKSRVGSVTWSDVKGREKLDLKTLFSEFGITDEAIEKHTQRGEGYRSFTFRPKK